MGDTTNESTVDTDIKKPVKEIPVIQDEGSFMYDTGDTYDGFFEAKKKDRSVKMHGPGVYKTAEGDIYTGKWENDRLGANEEVTIEFTDNSKFQGFFKDWSYSGRGKYFYPDNSTLQCDFVDNVPSGNLTLIDPNGHTWLGRAEQGYGWFEPVNHFYNMLETNRESTRVKTRDSMNIDTSVTAMTSDSKSTQKSATKSATKSTQKSDTKSVSSKSVTKSK